MAAQNASGGSAQPKPERADPTAAAPEPTTPGRTVITKSSSTYVVTPTPIEPTASAKDKALDAARQKLAAKAQTDAPSFLRLAFHDAGTYDAASRTGGPNGSIRLFEELIRDENKDIERAVNICGEIKSNCDKEYGMGTISCADLYQLAGVVAVETIGGPKIDFHGGRKDSNEPAPPDRLPKANKNDGPKEVAAKLRHVYYRMGFEDKEIVALSRAHTLGSAPSSDGSASEGGSSKNNLKFDSSYFSRLLQNASKSASVVAATAFLPDDRCLVVDPIFRKYVELYAKDGDAFLKDYAKAHKKMSELGFRQFPQAVRYGEKDYKDMKSSIYIATIVTIAVAFLGYMYETMKK